MYHSLFPRTYDGHEYLAGCCHTAEVLYLSHQVVSCRIIVHVLHRLAGSAVMIVQCGTTKCNARVWWKSTPRIVVARFLPRVLWGKKKRPVWRGKAELFIRSRGTARSAVASLWLAYKTITTHNHTRWECGMIRVDIGICATSLPGQLV
jgi:hypothetical protein